MKSFVDFSSIHETWHPFFDKAVVSEIDNIQNSIGTDFNPAPELVLRFSTVDLNKVKVIILGQDPYPQRGIPTGRSFEVNGLNSWLEKFKQASLRNILRSLYNCYMGELKTLNEIRLEIEEGRFDILPPNEIFDYWESQGVLMLNTYLTCQIEKPGSHQSLWSSISLQLIKYITSSNSNAVWFLWGKEARSNIKFIGSRKTYVSNHPMIGNPKNPDDFLNNPCFKETLKHQNIDWIGVNMKGV